ncbi:hypothetical protein IWQ60_002178 [Tieghemiomyces parasiticus]|uniref:Uncharacterized protein n=1 Tax=Tieghemiomyces parasiticus TaxID=78921 RepID=A0A9W8AHX7_9FUNG|nr:hypothetical protein IWQ60_002178 [Tieghemiomyces parasiticus]
MAVQRNHSARAPAFTEQTTTGWPLLSDDIEAEAVALPPTGHPAPRSSPELESEVLPMPILSNALLDDPVEDFGHEDGGGDAGLDLSHPGTLDRVQTFDGADSLMDDFLQRETARADALSIEDERDGWWMDGWKDEEADSIDTHLTSPFMFSGPVAHIGNVGGEVHNERLSTNPNPTLKSPGRKDPGPDDTTLPLASDSLWGIPSLSPLSTLPPPDVAAPSNRPGEPPVRTPLTTSRRPRVPSLAGRIHFRGPPPTAHLTATRLQEAFNRDHSCATPVAAGKLSVLGHDTSSAEFTAADDTGFQPTAKRRRIRVKPDGYVAQFRALVREERSDHVLWYHHTHSQLTDDDHSRPSAAAQVMRTVQRSVNVKLTSLFATPVGVMATCTWLDRDGFERHLPDLYAHLTAAQASVRAGSPPGRPSNNNYRRSLWPLRLVFYADLLPTTAQAGARSALQRAVAQERNVTLCDPWHVMYGAAPDGSRDGKAEVAAYLLVTKFTVA